MPQVAAATSIQPTRLSWAQIPANSMSRLRLVSGALCLALAAAACDTTVPHARPPQPSVAAASSTQSDPRPGGSSPGEPDSERRIVRAADVSLETDTPELAASRIGALAESEGGFVVSSDAVRLRTDNGDEDVKVTVVFRVPASAFDVTLESVRTLGKRVSAESVRGQDVTEEYVDLEARLKARRAIEDQYMAVLKEAKTIRDILEAQEKLGDVRTEIERAEGRRRFLDNQTSLATFTVRLAQHIEAVDSSGPGFGKSLKQAGHDVVAVSIEIVNGAIRTAGVLLPVGVLLGVPVWLVVRFLLRRRRRKAS